MGCAGGLRSHQIQKDFELTRSITKRIRGKALGGLTVVHPQDTHIILVKSNDNNKEWVQAKETTEENQTFQSSSNISDSHPRTQASDFDPQRAENKEGAHLR